MLEDSPRVCCTVSLPQQDMPFDLSYSRTNHGPKAC